VEKVQDKYNNHLNELIKTLSKIEILIEDNNQNVKDCMSIVKEINNIISPKKRGSFLSLIANLFGGKDKIM
jgi:hypothetical protein